MESYYEILMVSEKATSKEIQSSYRKLALKNHPDNGGSPAIFRLIQEAYEILSDPTKRIEYDRHRSSNVPQGDDSSKPNFLRYKLSPSRFILGDLEWNETKILAVKFSWEGNLTGELNIDWEKLPVWSQPPEVLPYTGQSIEINFLVDASKVDHDSYFANIKMTITNVSGTVVSSETIPVAFSVQKIQHNSSLSLQGTDRIKCGPLEVGQGEVAKATLNNTGDPIWQIPTFVWAGSRPPWADDINIKSIPGRIFPLDISFEVHTLGWPPGTRHIAPGTYSAKIEARVGSQIIGVIPVTFQVLKVPVPELGVYAAGRDQPINFGTMEWNESKFFDIKITNTGDPLKKPIQCSTPISWLQLAELNPKDLNSFPKVLRVTAQAQRINTPGDYVGEVNITHDGTSWKIPVVARIGLRPNLKADPPTFNKSVLFGTVSGEVKIINTGGNAPVVRISWEKDDYHTKCPTHNGQWPLIIQFKLTSLASHERYQNALIVEVLDDDERSAVTKLRIPITLP